MLSDVLLIAHAIISVLLVIVVLLQRSDGGMGALGGEGGNAVFAAVGSDNPLAKATKILAGLFMVTSLALAITMSGMARPESVMDSVPAGAEKAMDSVLPVVPSVLTEENGSQGE